MQRRSRLNPMYFVYGLLMGSADVVPGVSGGTVALILGIYAWLIGSISTVAGAAVTAVRGNFGEVRTSLARVDWGMLVLLLLGIATAIGVGSLFIPQLMERYPIHTRGLFFGLVAASVLVPWMRIARPGKGAVLLALAMAVVAFLLTGLPPQEISDPPLPLVFGSAAVAICAMILPGLSGAFLLQVFGLYRTTLHAINPLTGTFDPAYIVVFGLGAILGLGLFSRVLRWLLEHRHDATMAALVGVMVGALRALWPWQLEDRTLLLPQAGDPVASVLAVAALGMFVVGSLIWWSNSRIARSV